MTIHRIGMNGIRAHFVHVAEDQLPCLIAFDCQFDETDHHVAELIVGGVTYGSDGADFRNVLLGLSDLDTGVLGLEGGDLRSVWMDYYDIADSHPGFEPALRSVNGRRRGTGELLMPIPPVADHETVFLRGFELGNPGGQRNHHIRAIGVRFDARENAWRVTFRDDSPGDDAFAAYVHYIKVNKTASPETAQSWRFSEIRSLSREFRDTVSVRKNGIQGVTLLAGFHFEFLEGDHHLRKIAVNLRDIRRVDMTFKDNGNPPVAGTVDYVELSGYD